MSTESRASLGSSRRFPISVRDVYRQSARTAAPERTRRSTRWLPMKPAAPVTSTVVPRSSAMAHHAIAATAGTRVREHVGQALLERYPRTKPGQFQQERRISDDHGRIDGSYQRGIQFELEP